MPTYTLDDTIADVIKIIEVDGDYKKTKHYSRIALSKSVAELWAQDNSRELVDYTDELLWIDLIDYID
jgi:hypothetical protein